MGASVEDSLIERVASRPPLRLFAAVFHKFSPLNVNMQSRQLASLPYIHSSRNCPPYKFPYVSLYTLNIHFHITNITNFIFYFFFYFYSSDLYFCRNYFLFFYLFTIYAQRINKTI
jgi:hypothetical protein